MKNAPKQRPFKSSGSQLESDSSPDMKGHRSDDETWVFVGGDTYIGSAIYEAAEGETDADADWSEVDAETVKAASEVRRFALKKELTSVEEEQAAVLMVKNMGKIAVPADRILILSRDEKSD